MGKSSLRVQVMQRLQADGVLCGVLEVSAIVEHGMTSNEWYRGLISQLKRSLGLPIKPHLWWREREDLAPIQRFQEFLEDVLLGTTSQPIVIFIDEIDSLFAFDFSDDFFALIRTCCQHRVDNSAFQRLTFVLLGVATPTDLIQNKQRTPFNIGRAIDLQGFQLDEVAPLAPGIATKADNPQAVLTAILTWTGGQPFLTQKVCQLIAESPFTIAAGSETDLVGQLVQNRIIHDWEDQDHPEHLATIRNRLLADEQQAGRLLGLYQQILQQGAIAADDSPEQMTLRLSGLVVKRHSQLQVYNPIYQAVFTESWVEQKLAALRPYTEAITAWLASDCRDESRLLQGQALKDAQEWAVDKSLGDRDYRFLSASREVEGRIVRQKNQILEAANRKAKRRIFMGSVVLGIALLGFGISLPAMLIANKEKAGLEDDIEQLNQQQEELKNTNNDLLSENKKVGEENQNLWQQNTQINQDNQELGRERQQIKAELGEAIATLTSKEGALAQVETDLAQTQSDRDAAISDRDAAISERTAAQASRDTAIRERTAAQLETEQARTVTELQREGNRALQLFELAQIEGLLLSMRAASGLDALISPNNSFTTSLERLTTFSPISALISNLASFQLFNELEGHQGEVLCVRLSPDGKTIATGSADETVKLWDAETLQLMNTLNNNQGSVLSIDFSPDSQTLAINSTRELRLWNIQTGAVNTLDKSLHSGAGHKYSYGIVRFSPDGQTLAAVSDGGEQNLWNVQSYSKTPISEVKSLSFSPTDSHLIALGGNDGTLRLRNIETQIEVVLDGHRGIKHQGSITSVGFSPDGKILISGGSDGILRLWDMQTHEVITTLRANQVGISSIEFSRDGKILATASNGVIKSWDFQSLLKPPYHEYLTIRENDISGRSISFSSNSQILVSSSLSNNVRLWWSISPRNEMFTLRQDPENLTDKGCHPSELSSERVALVICQDGIAKLWDAKEYTEICPLPGHHHGIQNVKFSPDGQKLALSYSHHVSLWDVNTCSKIGNDIRVQSIYGMSFSPDNQILALGGFQEGDIRGIITLWDVQNQTKISPDMMTNPNEEVLEVSFSSGGQLLASSGRDGVLRLWDVQNHTLRHTIPGNQGQVESLRFSPDDRILASGSANQLKLWDVQTQREIANLRGHQDSIAEISFSPNGQIIASGGDGMIKLWDIEARMEIASLSRFRGGSIIFSEDDQTIAWTSDDGIRMWPTQLSNLLELGCKTLEDYFSTHPEALERLPVCRTPP
jgi:WD40 repeat protein